MHILIAEDDKYQCDTLVRGLKDARFTPDPAYTAKEALSKIRTNEYDLAIIDWIFPGENIDGTKLVKELRRCQPKVPIIMLTTQTAAAHVREGLGCGATFYFKKPFILPELMSHVNALLRDFGSRTEDTRELVNGPLRMDIFSYKVALNKKPLKLNNKEFQLLRHFMTEVGNVVTRGELIEKVWGDTEARMASNTIDVHVRHLRSKLGKYGEKYLITVRRVGHRLEKYELLD